MSCYVAIRAGIAKTPENSAHTSIHQRIRARQQHQQREQITAHHPRLAPSIIRSQQLTNATNSEATIWLSPLAQCTPHPEAVANPLTIDDYCELVDATGRMIAHGKRGAIPDHLATILDRLNLDAKSWVHTAASPKHFLGSAIGSLAARSAEAAKRGLARIIDTARCYRRPSTS